MIIIMMIGPVQSCAHMSTETLGIPEWASDLTKKVPYDAELAWATDLRSIRADADLKAYYDAMKDSFNYISVNQYMMNWSFYQGAFTYIVPYESPLDFQQIDFLVDGRSYRDFCFITPSGDIGRVEGYLDDNGWSRSEYEGFTVWRIEVGSAELKTSKSVAYNHELIIAGIEHWVVSIIDTINGKQPSICEKKQFQNLMALVSDMCFHIGYAEVDFEVEDGSLIRLVIGVGKSKKNSDFVEYKIIITGQDGSISDDVIQKFMNELKDDEELSQSKLKITRNGLYVIITADIPISTYIYNQE